MTPPVIHRVTTLDLAVRALAVAVRASAARRHRCAFRAQAAREADLERPRPAGARSGFRRRALQRRAISRPISQAFWRGATGAFPTPTCSTASAWARCAAADGAFVLGEMGQHTSNAGRIYFPSGTPDLDDIRDGAVDIAGSVAREVRGGNRACARGLSRRARTGTAWSPAPRSR